MKSYNEYKSIDAIAKINKAIDLICWFSQETATIENATSDKLKFGNKSGKRYDKNVRYIPSLFSVTEDLVKVKVRFDTGEYNFDVYFKDNEPDEERFYNEYIE